MKKLLGCSMLLMFMWTGAQAQGFGLGDIMGAAQEAFGDATTTAKTESDGIQELIDAINMSNKPELKKMAAGVFGITNLPENSSNSTTGNCLEMMGAYVSLLAYCHLKAKNANDPCTKKEWLGLKSLTLLAGASLSYCPQEFYYEEPEDDIPYDLKIANYFYGDIIVNDDSPFAIDNQEDYIKHTDEVWKEMAELGEYWGKDYYKTYGNHQLIYNHAFGVFATVGENVQPHPKLYMQFLMAHRIFNTPFSQKPPKLEEGEQGPLDYDLNSLLFKDFVGVFFKPDFQLAKTLEVAQENDKLKCNQ